MYMCSGSDAREPVTGEDSATNVWQRYVYPQKNKVVDYILSITKCSQLRAILEFLARTSSSGLLRGQL